MKNLKQMIIFLVALFMAISMVDAQVHLEEISFRKLYSAGTGQAKKIISTNDNGFLVVGNTGVIVRIPTYYQYEYSTAFEERNGWAEKFDSLGNTQWSIKLDESQSNSFTSGIRATDGTYVLTGVAYHFDSLTNKKYEDILIAKLDSTGNILFDTIFTKFAYQEGIEVKEDVNGDVLVFTNNYEIIPTLEEHWDNLEWEFYQASSFWRIYKIDKETNEISLASEIKGVAKVRLTKVLDAEDGGFYLWGDGYGFHGENPLDGWMTYAVKINENSQPVQFNEINCYGYFEDVIKTDDGGFAILGRGDYSNPDAMIFATASESFEETSVAERVFSIGNKDVKHLFRGRDSTFALVTSSRYGQEDILCCVTDSTITYIAMTAAFLITVNPYTQQMSYQLLKENFNAANVISLGNGEYILAGTKQPRYLTVSSICYCGNPYATPALYRFRWVDD